MKFWSPILVNILTFLDFQNAEICKNEIFENVLGFLIFYSILAINRGSKGPSLVNVLEVPKMSKKHIGICPQALTRHFKPIINHKNHQNIITYQKTNRLIILLYFSLYTPLSGSYRAYRPRFWSHGHIHQVRPSWKLWLFTNRKVIL